MRGCLRPEVNRARSQKRLRRKATLAALEKYNTFGLTWHSTRSQGREATPPQNRERGARIDHLDFETFILLHILLYFFCLFYNYIYFYTNVKIGSNGKNR